MDDTERDEETIYHAARRIGDREERAAYLRGACGDDAALRDRLEGLLRACEEDASFLEVPAVGLPLMLTLAGAAPTPERPGTVVGPYRLLGPIGEGGMGAVYLAEQAQPVRRRVALKVIKPGMDTRQVIARFEAERQALAMMDHPNIARVLDAGATDSGLPYFVMELVRGLPITEYCDREQLAIRDRLELFVLVCRAVQHAHQKGIIHRDLKPSNILVTLIDGAPVPKVIDFGVAKAVGWSLTERTFFTGFHQIVGTPMYMSPEQADLAAADLDTRSDIYSLGVLLYELLTGMTPFDGERLRSAAFDEFRRIIREEEPPRPSTRLSTLEAAATRISARRRSDPKRLGSEVRGELDWIVMKALEKDRNRRYETANDLAADLRRHLTGQPVEACPPSAWYRLSKSARRHRSALTTAVLIGLALIAGTAVSSWQAIRATRAGALAARREQEARSAAAQSDAVLRFLVHDLLGASEYGRAPVPDLKVADVFAVAEKKIDTAFPDQPLVEAGVRHSLAVACDSLGQYGLARRHGSRARDLRLALLGPEHPDTLQSTATLAGVFLHSGQSDAARGLHEQALDLRRRVLGPEHPDTLRSMCDLALVLGFQGRFREAQELYGQTLRIQQRILGPDHIDTLQSLCYLANAHQDAGDLDQADRLLRDLLGRHRKMRESIPFHTARALSMLGLNLLRQRRYIEAEPVLRECLALREQKLPDHWNSYNAISMLGEALLGQERHAEAEPALLRGYEGMKQRESRIPGPGKVRLAEAAVRLVRLYEATRQPEKARAWLETLRQDRDRIEAARNRPAAE